MNKYRINIAIIEPSDIICDGLSNMLMRSDKNFYLYRLNEPEDLINTYGDIVFNIAIINPVVMQNKKSDFLKLKKSRQNMAWIGLIYSFFDTRLLNIFDDNISVTDPQETITNKINSLLNKSEYNDNRQEQLSERETEVLVNLVKGLSHKEIADLMNISIHTVTSHRKNIIEKTGIKSLSGLTIYAISRKIIPLDSITPF